METSRRVIEQQRANTYMTNLRVTSDVDQVLPGGNHVDAHTPKVVKVYGHEVPRVLAMVRTEQEVKWLDEAEVEFKKRLEKYRDGIDDPTQKAKAEQLFPESIQSVFHLFHSDAAIQPLLTVERQCNCKACDELYYAANGAGCPKCAGEGVQVQLPPPKQIEQYDATNVLIERLMTEFLPKMTALNAELLANTVHETVERLVEEKLEELTKPGGKAGRK